MRPAAQALGLLLITAASGCSTINQPAIKNEAEKLEPGTTSVADIERRWGPPTIATAFMQGHLVWQYYRPQNGMSLASFVPLADTMSTERGRPAQEVVLLFDRGKILRQVLIRELPNEHSTPAQ